MVEEHAYMKEKYTGFTNVKMLEGDMLYHGDYIRVDIIVAWMKK